MMLVNADLHIHSRFSGGTSYRMNLKNLSEGAKLKGIQILATGDCLHPLWIEEIKDFSGNKREDGIFDINGVNFVLSAEVEDRNRVHHLILFPSLYSVHGFREEVSKHSKNIDRSGRPFLDMNGEEIASAAADVDALIGPAHAFTPWTAMYAYHDSLEECYGDMASSIRFLELGLSADSDYADRISELHRLTFLSNSDSHSPSPVRLAREFNRLDIQEFSWDEIRKAILCTGGRKVVLNAGFPPEEGKYNRTACTSCYRQYSVQRAESMKWRCKCGGLIKKGVRDRVDELSDYKKAVHPPGRAKYIHILPLAEIIGKSLHFSPLSKTVNERWRELMKRFGSEINVLIDADIDEISRIASPAVASAIHAFRKGKIKVNPGGGGRYGEIEILTDSESREENAKQKDLVEWMT
jgi:uncharacterized protein (TIGR00375 family)